MNDKTAAFLRLHAGRYPLLTLQDIRKALFQSAFGCEHLLADPSAARDYIVREAADALPCIGPVIEELDGPYCRVHLDLIRMGADPEEFTRRFVQSAEHRPEAQAELEEKLDTLLAMTRQGMLPFDPDRTEEMIRAWRSEGCPPCHHSEEFRAAYHPAYRLMRTELARELEGTVRKE